MSLLGFVWKGFNLIYKNIESQTNIQKSFLITFSLIKILQDSQDFYKDWTTKDTINSIKWTKILAKYRLWSCIWKLWYQFVTSVISIEIPFVFVIVCSSRNLQPELLNQFIIHAEALRPVCCTNGSFNTNTLAQEHYRCYWLIRNENNKKN